MKIRIAIVVFIFLPIIFYNCQHKRSKNTVQLNLSLSAKDILGNPEFRAISYGGYRFSSREYQPTVTEIKEDMKILYAMDIRVLRTYNVHFAHAANVLEAIRELKNEDHSFEMYVMLGAWINCESAFTDHPNHNSEDTIANQCEIDIAVQLAKDYSDIVKIISVGNEAMVKWATSYFVQPWVILKYVNQLQELKANGVLSKDLFITSSDNFASWGGGDTIYHVDELVDLIKAVDFLSLHTYPMHDTHYNPAFWGTNTDEVHLNKQEQIKAAMQRSLEYAISQYKTTKNYLLSLGTDKRIHIGETGWASSSNGHYGTEGSRASDEYKQGLYHDLIRNWTDENDISCFYFEGFDEIWKDAGNPGGSENYFGLFTINGNAKFAIWDKVDEGVFKGLSRNGQSITKSHNGSKQELLKQVLEPPIRSVTQ